MAERDLIINLRIDRAAAQQQSQQFHAQERQQIEQTTRAQRDASGRMRDEHGRFTSEGTRGFREVGEAGTKSFNALGIAAGLAQVGFKKLLDMALEVGVAVEKAAAKREQLTKGFLSQQDQLRELASLMGREAGPEFTLDMAKYGTRTGMRPDESRQFLTELYNSGAQFKGQTISGPEFEQFSAQAGRLGVARGYEPGSFGNIAGTTLGFQDFTRFGEGGSEQALSQLNQAMSILQHGKGRSEVLANQFSMLTSAALNEDQMLGTFTNVMDASIAISIAAEKHDAQAAEMVKIATRGLRGFGAKDKQAPLLRQAGITPQTGFLQSIEQLAPEVAKQAEAGGVSTQDVLRRYFDEAEADAIATFINKGATGFGGGFAERRQFGATVATPQAALDTSSAFFRTQPGMLRQRDAEVAQAEAERGAENANLEVVRREALAGLIRTRQIDTTATNLTDYLGGTVGFGTLGTGERRRIDLASADILNRRTPEGLRGQLGVGMFDFSPEARESSLNRQIEGIQGAGGNPFADFVQRGGQLERAAVALERAADKLNGAGDRQPARQPPVLQARPQAPPARLPGNG